MRHMRNVWILVTVFLGCADAPTVDLQVRANGLTCRTVTDCGIATGTDVTVDAYAEFSSGDNVTLTQIEVVPAGLIDATILGGTTSNFHALSAGVGHVHATLTNGSETVVVDRDVRVADIASTTIDPDVFPVPRGPDHFVTYVNYEIPLYVNYRDANGDALVGHGLENWATTDGSLYEDPDLSNRIGGDSMRMRYIDVGTTAGAVVTASGTTFTVDVRAVGAATSISLLDSSRQLFPTSATIARNVRTSFALVQKTSDGLQILADAGAPQITVDDPSIVQFLIYDSMNTFATGLTSGTTAVHVTQDGATSTFQITVL